MEYNTKLKQLTLPEYGRNIHNMIEYCMTLETKEERTRCAGTIIGIMGNMFPHLRDVNDFKHILWDHIAIMSDFNLDINYPYKVVSKEELNSKPRLLTYSRPRMKFRHYGNTLEQLVEIIPTIEDEEARKQLTLLVASQMKKSYVYWNKEVDDAKIFADLYSLSDGNIDLRDSAMKLAEVKEVAPRPTQNNSNNNRKKKK